MSKDYYEILEIPKDATHLDIQKAYRRLALKWHPNKNIADQTTSTALFNQISEAYEVLNNAVLRAYYDQFGEQKLKEGIIDQQGYFRGGYLYKGNAQEIFEKFTGTTNPFFDIFEGTHEGEEPTIFGSAIGGLKAPPFPAPENLEVSVECTLEELFLGTIKKLVYHRRTLNPDKRTSSTREIIKSIQIHPGYSNETVLVFQGEGHEVPGQKNSNLIVRVKEIPHNIFKRHKNNLSCVITISLLDALESKAIEVTSLDGRVLSISVDEVINPATKKWIENEGMPIYNQENFNPALNSFGIDGKQVKKGHLIIGFDIQFPSYIEESKKQLLREALA